MEDKRIKNRHSGEERKTSTTTIEHWIWKISGGEDGFIRLSGNSLLERCQRWIWTHFLRLCAYKCLNLFFCVFFRLCFEVFQLSVKVRCCLQNKLQLYKLSGKIRSILRLNCNFAMFLKVQNILRLCQISFQIICFFFMEIAWNLFTATVNWLHLWNQCKNVSLLFQPYITST